MGTALFCCCCNYYYYGVAKGWGAWRLQCVLDIRHLNVIAVFIIAAHLKYERSDMRFDLFLRHLLHHLGHRQLHAFLTLGLGHEKRIQHRDALRQHCDLQSMLRLEVVEEFGERHFALQLETIPQSPFDGVVLLGERLDWFGASEKGQRQVKEVVLESLDIGVAKEEYHKYTF